MDGSVTDQAVVRHIHLSPLGMEQMNLIVMETLNSDADSTLILTELLYRRSDWSEFLNNKRKQRQTGTLNKVLDLPLFYLLIQFKME